MTDVATHAAGPEHSLMDDLVRRPRLLVVDGQPDRAQALTASFSDDYQVDIASTAEQAVQAIATHPPDLMLLDGGLDDGGAFALCRRLRSQSLAPELPAIVVTESGDQLTQLQALEAGAVDFIARPIHPKILSGRVWAQVMLRRQAALLRQWVYIDGLTGVCNRGYFDERLAAEWARAVRQGTELGVLRVELDGFAHYNQRHGHARGDDALRRIAALLKSSLQRPGDLVARWSGADFICLLPETELEGGLDLAHRLGIAVRALAIEHADSGITPAVLTVSMGLATKPYDMVGSVALLLDESAAQLELARSRGRNRYCGVELEDL